MEEKIILGRWDVKSIEKLLNESASISDVGGRIEFLSGRFLGVPYKESSLIGDENTSEVFVIDLEGVDCFTFLEYIEAMRLSVSFAQFGDNLRRVRYSSGEISYRNRNHFFTDWQEHNINRVENITEFVGNNKTKRILKKINEKDDGTLILPGVSCTEREVMYIPSEDIDSDAIERLRTGDYAGIYSFNAGLDVSHVGIIIKEGDELRFRHASSIESHRKVLDESFEEYIKDKPGITILRPK